MNLYNSEASPLRHDSGEQFVAMRDFFWQTIHRSDISAANRWALGLISIIVLMPIFGSVLDIVFVVMAFYAVQYFFWDKVKFTRAEKYISAIALFYLGATFFFSIIQKNPWDGIVIASANLGLIAAIILLPVLRRAPLPEGGKFIRLAFPTVGIIIPILSVLDIVFRPTNRAELFLGNPLILSYIAGANALLCLVFAINAKGFARIFSFAGFLGSLIALFSTGGRGPILAFTIVGCIYFLIWVLRLDIRKAIASAIATILVIAGTLFLLQDFKPVKRLVLRTSTLMHAGLQGELKDLADESTRIRVSFYQSGYQLFVQKPFIGHGLQNTMNAAKNIAPEPEQHWYDKTHLHNAYLTELVSSGIIGLLALIALTLTPLIAARKTNRPTKDAAALFTLFTTLCFMTNIGFYHDIMVFYFCTILVTLNWLGNGRVISTE